MFINIVRLAKRIGRKSLSPVVFLLKRTQFRFATVIFQRIGHLCMEPHAILIEQHLGRMPKYKIVIVAGNDKPANPVLLKYWEKHFYIVKSPLLSRLLKPLAGHPDISIPTRQYAVALHETAKYYELVSTWNNRKQFIEFSKEDVATHRAYLQSIGMTEKDWYVVLHCRTPGYAPNEDQEYRDADIQTMNLAIDEIISRGGWVIRLGDPSMPKLAPRARLVDYAHSKERCALLDITLPSYCRFFLGSASGLGAVAALMGRPAASANIAPMSATLHVANRDLAIPKLVFSHSLNRFLTMAEIMGLPLADFRYGIEFVRAGVSLVDNSPEEIRDMTAEMLDRLDRSDFSETPLQKAAKAWLRPGHFTFGSGASFSHRFVERHKALFVKQTPSRQERDAPLPLTDPTVQNCRSGFLK